MALCAILRGFSQIIAQHRNALNRIQSNPGLDLAKRVRSRAPSCSCLPEHYTVSLQTAQGVTLDLKPTLLDPVNATC